MNTVPRITEPLQIEKQYALQAAKEADFGENWLITATRALALQNIAYQTNPPQCAPQESEYITAAQARGLGAGAEYYASAEDCWKTCAFLENFPPTFEDGEVIKYRAIKQAQPEPSDPHAALRAEYIRQRDAVPCELEFYSWERKDKGMADFAKLGVPPAFFPFHEYRCTDISCYVSKDGGTAIRMLRTNAQALQRKLGGTVDWYYPTAIKAGPWNLDFDGKGTYTYRTKATINLDGNMVNEPQKAFEAAYPHYDQRLGADGKHHSRVSQDAYTYFTKGVVYGRKQALEDVANGFIKQKSWTQDMAHAVVQHAAREGALK